MTRRIVQPLERGPAPQAPATEAPRPARAASRAAEPLPGVRSTTGFGLGEPLPQHVRERLEEGYGVGLGAVRLHRDPRGREAADRIGARAFAYGPHIVLGAGERPDDVELVAHEAAHVIQQRAAPQVQGHAVAGGDALEREARAAAATVAAGGRFAVRGRTGATVQPSLLRRVLDTIGEKAHHVMGFGLLTLVLGVNPISLRRVERTGRNFVRAIVGLALGGDVMYQALERHGIVDAASTWLGERVDELGVTWRSIRDALLRFVDGIRLRDVVFSPGEVWDRGKRIVTEPAARILAFARSVGGGIVRLIRTALLRPLARLAEGTRAYDLLRLALRRDPITDEPHPWTAENVIGGAMRLIGQEERWRQLQQSKAVPRAFAWFKEQLILLGEQVAEVPGLFAVLWDRLALADLLDVRRAFAKVRAVFGGVVGRFVAWARQAALHVMTVIFEAVAPRAMPVLRRAGSALRAILSDPVRFVRNLVRAGAMGFQRFAAKIRQHLVAGLAGWLTGALGGAGLRLPERWDARGVLAVTLQLLGLTWRSLRQKIVQRIPEPVLTKLEASVDVVGALAREGPAAAWSMLADQLQTVRDTVFAGIRDWVARTVVARAVRRIALMLTPAGAVIQAIVAIYDTIVFFRERLRQIGAAVSAFFGSIGRIAAGAIGAAAARVEGTLGRMVPLVVSFLARFIGLGGVADTIRTIVERVRAPIDRALDRVVDWVVAQGQRLVGAVAGGVRGAAERVTSWWRARKVFRANDGARHTLFFEGEGREARLMIASNRTAYRTFVEAIDVRGRPPHVQAAKTAALDVAREIDARFRAVSGTGMQTPEIVDWLNRLAIHTAVLAEAAHADPPSVIEYGPLGPDGGATSMNARVLSRNRAAGTGVTDKAPIWKLANRRRGKYVQGHLLNEKLGGPGRAYNLSPITRSANAMHNSAVERYIKGPVAQGKVVRYYVAPLEGAHPDRESQKDLRRRVANLERKLAEGVDVDRRNGGTVADVPADDPKLELSRLRRILDVMDYEQAMLTRAFKIDWKFLKAEVGPDGSVEWKDDPTCDAPPIVGVTSHLPNDADFEPGPE